MQLEDQSGMRIQRTTTSRISQSGGRPEDAGTRVGLEGVEMELLENQDDQRTSSHHGEKEEVVLDVGGGILVPGRAERDPQEAIARVDLPLDVAGASRGDGQVPKNSWHMGW